MDDDWERDLEREEFREPRRFRCAGVEYCGSPSCHRCFPGNTYDKDYYGEDDPVIDLLN
jgi:hypothetical protein